LHQAAPLEAAYELAAHVLAVQAEASFADLPSRAEQRRANDVSELIEARAEKGAALSLHELSAQVGLSPFHLLRTFRRVVGLTPHQYLLRYRVRRAMALLRDPNLSVTQVAYDAGFGDVSNFIRMFGRHLGCSPRAFRQRIGAATSAKISRPRPG
jgi:AraC-like DNA-binding protein